MYVEEDTDTDEERLSEEVKKKISGLNLVHIALIYNNINALTYFTKELKCHKKQTIKEPLAIVNDCIDEDLSQLYIDTFPLLVGISSRNIYLL